MSLRVKFSRINHGTDYKRLTLTVVYTALSHYRVTIWLFTHSPRCQTPTDFHIKRLKRRGFTKGWAFWSKKSQLCIPNLQGP